MAKVKVTNPSDASHSRRPALTPEARENQMIALAVDLAEKQMIEGTASSQIITHYLKLATVREQLERERLVKENALLEAKKQSITEQKEMKAVYEEALRAMKRYSGHGSDDDFEEEEYDD